MFTQENEDGTLKIYYTIKIEDPYLVEAILRRISDDLKYRGINHYTVRYDDSRQEALIVDGIDPLFQKQTKDVIKDAINEDITASVKYKFDWSDGWTVKRNELQGELREVDKTFADL